MTECEEETLRLTQAHRDCNQLRIERLEKQNKLLKECVQFYADQDNWDDCWIDGCLGSEDYFTSIKDDMGSRVGGDNARECLKKLK